MRERNNKPFSEEEAMEYFTMILIGLHALHSKKITHRDLKPGNILIDYLQDGTQILKIGDFGISKAADLQTMKVTQTTMSMVGTIAYMAPEVLNRDKPDSKVDIWALGVILYEFLTFKHPFWVEDALSIGAITNDRPFNEPKAVSPFIKSLLEKLLDKNPKTRFSTSQLLNIEEIKTYAQNLIKKIGESDPEYGQQLNEQLTEFMPKVEIKPFYLSRSSCKMTDEEIAFVQNVLEERKIGASLLYRGSQHGWMWEDFHKRCDMKGPTLTLMRLRDGPCIGGFTLCQWTSDEIGTW